MKNMIYMTRMGLWGVGTPFRTFEEFEKAAKSSGSLAVLMLVAMEMKVWLGSPAPSAASNAELEYAMCVRGGRLSLGVLKLLVHMVRLNVPMSSAR